MKNEKVVIKDDIIYLENNPRSIVMSKGAKALTETYCHIVSQNQGSVLDIGFGLGYSANMFHKLADHYTCIEINPQIYERALEWAKGKSNVRILFGDWVDIIPTLNEKFDGIFLDSHNDQNYDKIEDYAKLISKEGTILSVFNYFSIRDKEELNTIKVNLDSLNFPKPVTGIHNINWTYYDNGAFVKKNIPVKSKQSHLI